ncbi:MAG: hypothetical protein OXC63_15605 [Aestuariivita sp.]|nr:hypothetical protein [Aestuariivita sp.]MCY4348136.1 hypothetical protein [Aestuariivita sp.]
MDGEEIDELILEDLKKTAEEALKQKFGEHQRDLTQEQIEIVTKEFIRKERASPNKPNEIELLMEAAKVVFDLMSEDQKREDKDKPKIAKFFDGQLLYEAKKRLAVKRLTDAQKSRLRHIFRQKLQGENFDNT